MSTHTRIQTWAVGALVIVALGGLAFPVHSSTAQGASTSAIPRATFVWRGVFDLVGTGFPDGERKAVIHIEQADTSYSLVSMQGPPGALIRFHVVGDSARVIWNLGSELMVVDLRGAGDSLTGVWASGDWSGPVTGVRRHGSAGSRGQSR